ncbi:unnamed protein product [Ranitomeya imitator]|uniref:small monomeric GTPase n=1 Tax=Ranitomeya imitator TaxID=111125 RepID=A0ABN9KNH4_9NEOB|nr:unnamed protein product [Ranitomeya imitator]
MYLKEIFAELQVEDFGWAGIPLCLVWLQSSQFFLLLCLSTGLQMVVQQLTRMTDSSHQQHKAEANILVLGAENVGKSESIYTHNISLDGRDTSFSIWDSVCPQKPSLQSCVSEEQLRWADGFILVYSLCDRDSFSVVRQQLQRIRQLKKRHSSTPIIIVGNKRDLQHRRQISSEEGRLLAITSDCDFFEISAAETYHGSLVVFHQLLERVRASRSLSKKNVGIKGIVRSMSAVFGRRRTE